LSQFLNMTRKEFEMSARRIGLWVAFSILFIFYTSVNLVGSINGSQKMIDPTNIWPAAAHEAFKLNLFIPLLAGILAADRLFRDYREGVNELQESAPVSRQKTVMAKYFGVLLSLLLPCLIIVLFDGGVLVATGLASWRFMGCFLIASLVMNVPAIAFVTAFSLACPMIMPVRVYQVLFTGYWFWGNFLSPKVFPTVSGTLLNVSGTFALGGFFNGEVDPSITYNSTQAILNLVVIFSMIAAVLFALIQVLVHRELKK